LYFIDYLKLAKRSLFIGEVFYRDVLVISELFFDIKTKEKAETHNSAF